MDFSNSKNFIIKKIKDLRFPYFKIIVKKDFKEVFNYRYSEYNNNNDLLAMYSMSKVITSVAFMKLCEDGLVKPTDLVSKHLDGYDELKLIDGKSIKKPLKIEHLLTMTSGLDYNFNKLSTKELLHSNSDVSTVEIASTFAKDGILFEPGEKFNYSLGLDVVGAIIEKVSGIKLQDYIKKNIFDVAKMNDSTMKYDLSNLDKLIPDVLLTNNELKQIDKYRHLISFSRNYCSGGSGLISTVDDYSRFIDALLSHKIISKESINKMSYPYINKTPFNDEVVKYSQASFDYGYGYGVRVRTKASKFGLPIGEFGWDGATGSYCLIDPVNNISIVIGMNVQNWPSYLKDIHIKIAEHIYEDLLK